MYNKVILMGRLTRDPEIRYTESGKAVANFTIAVNRGRDREIADFFNITAWEKTAEFVCKYFSKGRSILVEGTLQNRKYTKDGIDLTVTEVIARSVAFTGEKKEAQADNYASYGNDTGQDDSNMGDDDLPF